MPDVTVGTCGGRHPHTRLYTCDYCFSLCNTFEPWCHSEGPSILQQDIRNESGVVEVDLVEQSDALSLEICTPLAIAPTEQNLRVCQPVSW